MRAVVGSVYQTRLWRYRHLLQKRSGSELREDRPVYLADGGFQQEIGCFSDLRRCVDAPRGAAPARLTADDAGPLGAAFQLFPIEADDVHIEETAHVVRLLDLHAESLDLLGGGVDGKIRLVPGRQGAGLLGQHGEFVLHKAQPKLLTAPEKGAVRQRRDLDGPCHIHRKGNDRSPVFPQQGVLDRHPFLTGNQYFGQ